MKAKIIMVLVIGVLAVSVIASLISRTTNKEMATQKQAEKITSKDNVEKPSEISTNDSNSAFLPHAEATRYEQTNLDTVFKMLAAVVFIIAVVVVIISGIKEWLAGTLIGFAAISALLFYAVGKHFELVNTKGKMLNEIQERLSRIESAN